MEAGDRDEIRQLEATELERWLVLLLPISISPRALVLRELFLLVNLNLLFKKYRSCLEHELVTVKVVVLDANQQIRTVSKVRPLPILMLFIQPGEVELLGADLRSIIGHADPKYLLEHYQARGHLLLSAQL